MRLDIAALDSGNRLEPLRAFLFEDTWLTFRPNLLVIKAPWDIKITKQGKDQPTLTPGDWTLLRRTPRGPGSLVHRPQVSAPQLSFQMQ